MFNNTINIPDLSLNSHANTKWDNIEHSLSCAYWTSLTLIELYLRVQSHKNFGHKVQRTFPGPIWGTLRVIHIFQTFTEIFQFSLDSPEKT